MNNSQMLFEAIVYYFPINWFFSELVQSKINFSAPIEMK